MKNIQFYRAEKYATDSYIEVSPNIFRHGSNFVTSLTFEQEPSLGEGTSAADISQYPLEDISDRFRVYVSDFYPSLNNKCSTICHLEFSAKKIDNINKLASIIGRRVYNRSFYAGGEECVELIIE